MQPLSLGFPVVGLNGWILFTPHIPKWHLYSCVTALLALQHSLCLLEVRQDNNCFSKSPSGQGIWPWSGRPGLYSSPPRPPQKFVPLSLDTQQTALTIRSWARHYPALSRQARLGNMWGQDEKNRRRVCGSMKWLLPWLRKGPGF